MAPRARKSDFSSRVTLYEPVSNDVPVASTSASSTPLKRTRVTRSTTASSPVVAKSLKEEESDFSAEELEEEKPSKLAKKATTPRKPKAFVNSLDRPHPAPKRWKEQLAVLKEQRKSIIAPVDMMGCEQGGRERDEKPPSDKEQRLSTLVSLMLSSQTKDPVTHQATMNLRNGLRGGLSLEGLLDATVEEIDALICKVGFHQTKAMNLQKLAIRLRDLHGGDVPNDLTDLLAINGVGPKMSLLYLQAQGINAGIGVDTHVHRISNRLGWHKPKTNTPEQTRLNLESWLPKDLHPSINKILVGFGQEICKPIGPRCDICQLAQASPSLCPSKQAVSLRKEKVKKEESPPKVKIEIEQSTTTVKSEEGETLVKQEMEIVTAKDEEGTVLAQDQEVLTTIKAEALSPSKPSLRETPAGGASLKPVGPWCDICQLAQASPSLCPSKQAVSLRKEKVKKEESPPKVKIEIEQSTTTVKSEEGETLVKQEMEIVTAKDEEGTVLAQDQEVLTTIKAKALSPSKPSLRW